MNNTCYVHVRTYMHIQRSSLYSTSTAIQDVNPSLVGIHILHILTQTQFAIYYIVPTALRLRMDKWS